MPLPLAMCQRFPWNQRPSLGKLGFPSVTMETWATLCGLFAAVLSMMLDVALFWEEVRCSMELVAG